MGRGRTVVWSCRQKLRIGRVTGTWLREVVDISQLGGEGGQGNGPGAIAIGEA